MKIFQIVVLVLSGLALFYACSMRLIKPSGAVFLQSYFEDPANSLESHVDLANEIRGVGAVMLLGGLIALLGAFRPDFQQTAFVVTTLIFAGVILGRSISWIFDGAPPVNLIRAAIAEAVLAVLNAYCMVGTMSESS
ncbi:MAG: DUF4345 domain-containing protein [Bacteroidota bacterium]